MFEKRTMSDYILEELRKDILELRYQPGEKLSEVQLSKKYEVSRAPIRDSLNRLEKEGLVLIKPQIGTIVAPISLNKARDICQVRLLLEPYAANVAAQNIRDEEIKLLTQQFDTLANLEKGTPEKRKYTFEVDSFLHKMILDICGNREIESILEGYRGEIQRIRRATAELANRLTPSEKEMNEIYKALTVRDSKKAEKAMFDHISNLTNAICKVLEDREELDS